MQIASLRGVFNPEGSLGAGWFWVVGLSLEVEGDILVFLHLLEGGLMSKVDLNVGARGGAFEDSGDDLEDGAVEMGGGEDPGVVFQGDSGVFKNEGDGVGAGGIHFVLDLLDCSDKHSGDLFKLLKAHPVEFSFFECLPRGDELFNGEVGWWGWGCGGCRRGAFGLLRGGILAEGRRAGEEQEERDGKSGEALMGCSHGERVAWVWMGRQCSGEGD